ncbi:MAG TPA: tetratricopeptide repeat protein [Thermoanaerobaculaceae bacterium]|nr:tetratricopeptide repeat protein [Thermoanaerobaculaceae bacterium]HRS16178.1 tetratricopeptide repeat protein [Thermoanaerobaculaceae bacterium]
MTKSVLDPVVLEPLTQRELARKNLEFGKKLLAGGDSRKAMKFFELSAEQEPSAEALILLARIELEFPGLRPKALEHLKQAVATEPRCTEAWLLLAEFWAARKDREKQRRCLEKILAYDPDNAEARRALNDMNLWD